MAVQQLGSSSFFGIGDSDKDRLERMAALGGNGPNTAEIFAAVQQSDPNSPYVTGTGDNMDKIVNGYRLLQDFQMKKSEISANPRMMHPKIVETDLAKLHQDVLELASILAVELFLQSTIVDDIKVGQAEQLEKKLRGPIEEEEVQSQFPQQIEDYLQHLAKNKHRQVQLQGWYFDPHSASVDGGIVWIALQDAKLKLAETRDSVLGGRDQARLANEMAAIPAVITRYEDIGQLIDWYTYKATPSQKLAMQMVGHQYIQPPKVRNPDDQNWRGYRQFLHTLEKDMELMLNEDEATLASNIDLQNAVNDAEASLRLIQEMRHQLSRPVIGIGGSGILSPKLGTDLDLLIYITENIKRPNPEAWAEAIEPWQWISDDNIPLSQKLAMRNKMKVKVETTIPLTEEGNEE